MPTEMMTPGSGQTRTPSGSSPRVWPLASRRGRSSRRASDSTAVGILEPRGAGGCLSFTALSIPGEAGETRDRPSVSGGLALESVNCRGRERAAQGLRGQTHMTGSGIALVTGSAGRIGQAVVKELKARGRAVRGFDLVPTPGADESVVGDVTDEAAVRRAAAGAAGLVPPARPPRRHGLPT